MKVHFIAIGGAAMHNLAIALKEKSYSISGSDDEIFEPSRSRLKKHGLLPDIAGWFPEKISKNTDAVILGMHAKKDNPELEKALSLNIPVYSYPEYLYKQTKDKKRLVIAGSHGKTTITSMVMHVLRKKGLDFDYMVGAKIEGFDTMTSLSEDAEIAVFEGDEYLSSPIDMKPKFLWYKPHAAVITGIAWDHANVFPTEQMYVEQFRKFINSIQPGGKLFYYRQDIHIHSLINENANKVSFIPYDALPYTIQNGRVWIQTDRGKFPVSVFGHHNIQNIEAARLICTEAGLDDEFFYKALQDFRGAARRLQLLAENKSTSVYLDFAHAPSKVKATCHAVKEQYPDKKLIACLELHTFSSLSKDFIPQYANSMAAADEACVYFNHSVVKHKNLPALDTKFIEKAFHTPIEVFTDSDALMDELHNKQMDNTVLLIMTSGSFDGRDLQSVAESITRK
ncbi:MAG: UDP-N-acetylmuramate--L-alanine ligase [Bacteroidota bacterium]